MSKPKNPAAVTLGRKGGLARRKALTPDQRKEIARQAARVRWDTEPSAPGNHRDRA